MAELNKENLETFKKYFLYIVIAVQSWVIYRISVRLDNVQELRIQDKVNEVQLYKEGYWQSIGVLQEKLRYENYRSQNNDTIGAHYLFNGSHER